MKKEYALLQSEVIMGVNLKMIGFNCSMKKMEFFTIFQHQELLKNGVVERNNRYLQEMARTMLNDNSTSKHF